MSGRRDHAPPPALARSDSPPPQPRTGRKAQVISPQVKQRAGVGGRRPGAAAAAPPARAVAGVKRWLPTAAAAPRAARARLTVAPQRGPVGVRRPTPPAPPRDPADAAAAALRAAALDGRLWHAACATACGDTIPTPVPTSFPSGAAYAAAFTPLLLEEARQSLRAAWADAAGARRTWPVIVDRVDAGGGGRGGVAVVVSFARDARRRPRPGDLRDGDVYVLTRGEPPSVDAADWAAGGRRRAAAGGVELEAGDAGVGADGARGDAPALPCPHPFAGVLRVTGATATVSGRGPCCPSHASTTTSAPCAAALAALHAGGDGWTLTPAGGFTTTLRELAALVAVCRAGAGASPLLAPLLRPPKARAGDDAPASGWPAEVSHPLFVDHLRASYDASQLAAIEGAARHLAARSGDRPPFTLIQGPPGTGKTHTVVAILNVWHLVAHHRHHAARLARNGASTPAARRPRLLVCAPSNAAADELLGRVMERGFVDAAGGGYRPAVVRVGSGDAAMTPRARAVWVDALVDALLDMPGVDRLRALQAARAGVVAAKRAAAAAAAGGGGLAAAVASVAATDALALAEADVARLEAADEGARGDAPARRCARDALENSFVAAADIVFTTLSSTGRRVFGRRAAGGAFATVLVDEAAQASEVATLQALALGAADAVLVGDPAQLPATVLSGAARAGNLQRSLFERLAAAGAPVAMLTVQYRMHPAIRAFPSARFYQGRLVDAAQVLSRPPCAFYHEPLLKPYAVFDVAAGREMRGGGGRGGPSLRNEAEAEMAAALYRALRDSLNRAAAAAIAAGRPPPPPVTVGVLTPYRAQVEAVTAALARAAGPAAARGARVATVDAFQGSEVDVAILTAVRARAPVRNGGGGNGNRTALPHGGVGFVDDVRRLNVAITRARRALWIVGNAETLSGSAAWGQLLADARARGVVVRGADAASLFPAHATSAPVPAPAAPVTVAPRLLPGVGGYGGEGRGWG